MIFFLYIPLANFKSFSNHIISLRLPKEYLNSHNCSFDIDIVKISTILFKIKSNHWPLQLTAYKNIILLVIDL